jgi:methyl halide transferase
MTPERADHWDGRYAVGDVPWDTGRVDGSLSRILRRFDIAPCAALEVGCGTGTNAIWLAEQGFRVTATDVSPLAVDAAGKKIAACGADVTVRLGDVLCDPVAGGPFGFVFDRGCFHTHGTPEERARFAETVAALLGDGGYWLSLIGSKDGPPRDVGPPRLSAADVVAAVEPFFEILSLESSSFDSDQPDPPRAWACLLRKRGVSVTG